MGVISLEYYIASVLEPKMFLFLPFDVRKGVNNQQCGYMSGCMPACFLVTKLFYSSVYRWLCAKVTLRGNEKKVLKISQKLWEADIKLWTLVGVGYGLPFPDEAYR